MIVQCESCQTRFHVADARIPEKGARVRCSRCHHRFHITPSSSVSGPQPSAAKQGSAQEPPRGDGPRLEGREDELDNPEFLFDEKSGASSRPPQTDAIEAAAQALRETTSAPPPEPPTDEPGHGLERGPADERVVASGGKTAQEMLDAGAPVLDSPRFEIGGELEGNDAVDETGTHDFSAAPPTPRPSPSAAKAERPAVAAVGRPARAELDALGKELGEDDDSSFAGWDPISPPTGASAEAAPEGKFFDLASAIAGTPAQDGPAAPPTSVFEQADLAPPAPAPAKKRSAPEAPVFDPEAAGAAAVILRIAAVLVGVALLGAAARGMWVRTESDFAGPQVVRADGWVAADLETFVARDALGERVLVVRGNLLPDGAAAPPQVVVRVLGRHGEVLAEAPRAWLERVDDAEVAPEALSVRLTAASADVAAIGQQVTGFTAVLPDPPPGARRVEISLQASAAPPRGTATAVAPPPAPSADPAPSVPPTSLAEPALPSASDVPGAPQAPGAPANDDVVPASPESVD